MLRARRFRVPKHLRWPLALLAIWVASRFIDAYAASQDFGISMASGVVFLIIGDCGLRGVGLELVTWLRTYGRAEVLPHIAHGQSISVLYIPLWYFLVAALVLHTSLRHRK